MVRISLYSNLLF